MNTLVMILQLLSYLPALQTGVYAPPAPAAHGQGVLVVAACRPHQMVFIMPGPYSVMTDAEGVAKINLPAQNENDDSYLVNGSRVNGIVYKGQMLTAVCP